SDPRPRVTTPSAHSFTPTARCLISTRCAIFPRATSRSWRWPGRLAIPASSLAKESRPMARSTPSYLHRCQSMEANGRTFVVNGYGFNKAAVGGGRLAVVVTNGTALPTANIPPFRHSHRIAGGGRFSVRLIVVARRHLLRHHLLLNVGAASTESSFRRPRRNAGNGVANATVPEKKRSSIVKSVGAASTDRSSRPTGRIAAREVANATARKKKRSRIVPSVGAASTDRSSRPTGRIAAREVVNATVRKKKRSRIVPTSVGAASTEKSSRPPRRIAGRGMANATGLEKKRSGIVHRHRPVGAASTENSSRLPRRFAGRGAVNATGPEKKRSGIVPKG